MASSGKQVPPGVPVPSRLRGTPPDPLLRQRAWAALTLGLLSVIGLLFLGSLQRGVYVVVLTLAFGGIAIWLGVTASRRARRGGMARPRGAMSGTVFGGLGLGLSATVLVAFAVFWPQLKAYSSCLAGANTVAAQQACQSQFNKSVGSEISNLESGH